MFSRLLPLHGPTSATALGGLSNVISGGSNLIADVAFSARANYDTLPGMTAAGVSPGPAGEAVVIGHVSNLRIEHVRRVSAPAGRLLG